MHLSAGAYVRATVNRRTGRRRSTSRIDRSFALLHHSETVTFSMLLSAFFAVHTDPARDALAKAALRDAALPAAAVPDAVDAAALGIRGARAAARARSLARAITRAAVRSDSHFSHIA